MKLVDIIPPGGIVHRLAASSREAALGELAAALAPVAGTGPGPVLAVLLERERLGSTGVGHGIAVPHGKLDLTRTFGVLGLSEKGIDFESPDGLPVKFVVALVSPLQGGGHLKALAAVAQELSDAGLRERLLLAPNAQSVYEVLSRPK